MARNTQFANWLKAKLAQNELTQADFARRLGVSTGTVSNWATGQRVPDPQSCDLIADVLGIDLDLVLWQAGHRPPIEEIDPADPRNDIKGLVDRIDWKADPGNVKLITRVLQTMLEEQRGRSR